MSKKFQDYFFKIKTRRSQIRLPFNTFSSSKNWVFSGCKHPRTPSFALYARNENEANHHGGNNNNNSKNKDDAATLADVDRFLLENFKSLYLKDDEETESNHNTKRVSEDQNRDEETPKIGSILLESPRLVETPRNLRGSTRFFVKPGFSGSLVEDALTSTSTNTSEESGSMTTTTTLNDISSSINSYDGIEKDHTLPDNSIALLTYSPSPYEDFKRSMQEMVEARSKNNLDWDFLEELLFCYLNLNEKKSHKFILSAFVDLITVMRGNSETASAKPRSVRTIRSLRTGHE